MATVILSRILGYGREVALYSLLGQNYMTDAYRAAFSIPDLIYTLLVGGALSSALIPVFSSCLADNREKEGWEAVSILTSWILIIMAVLILLAYVYTRPLITLLTPGLPAPFIEVAVGLTHIMLVQTVFMALNGLAMGILNSYRHFASPALGSLVYNLVIILVGMLFFEQWGIAAFSYGVALGAVLNFAVQIPALRRVGIRFRFSLHTDHPDFHQIIRLMVPVLAGLGVVQFNLFVTQNIASGLGSGVLSVLNLAQRIMNLPVGIFAVSIGTALFPTLAALTARGELAEYRRFMSLGIRATLFVGVPAAWGLLAIGEPLVSLLFEQREFTHAMVLTTSQVLTYYLPGLAAYACLQVVNRGFYALKAPLIPVLAAAAAIAANVILSLLLAPRYGAPGLAAAYALAGWINLGVLLTALRWKVGRLGGRTIFINFMITLFVSVIMYALVAWWVNWIPTALPITGKGGLLTLVGLGSLAGILVFGGLISRFKLQESEIIVQLIRRRLPGH